MPHSGVQYEQCAVIEFLFAEKESVRNIHLCNIYGSAALNRSAVGCWVKRVTASKMGKAELHDLPRLA